ncbi:MAG: hypothetical protein QXS06_03625 [Desulfurococcaceae archaeon]
MNLKVLKALHMLEILCNYSRGAMTCQEGLRGTYELRTFENYDVLYIPTSAESGYSLEVETPVSIRVVCNGERLGEFIWGRNRITRWEVSKRVEGIMCVFSDAIKLMDMGRIMLVHEELTEELKKLAKYIVEAVNLWSLLSADVVYDKYIALCIDNALSEVSPVPPLLSCNKLESARDLIRSTLAILNILDKAHSKSYIEGTLRELSNLELGPFLVFTYEVSRSAELKRVIDNLNECIEVKQGGRVFNKCKRRVNLIASSTKAWLKMVLEAEEEALINISPVTNVLSW